MNSLAENSVAITAQTKVAVLTGILSRRTTTVDSIAGTTAVIITHMNVRAAYLTDNGTVEKASQKWGAFSIFISCVMGYFTALMVYHYDRKAEGDKLMEAIFDESMIRAELRRLDAKTGLHAADLPIKFGRAKGTLGRFSYPSDGKLEFYFSNYYFQNPNHPVEEKIDTIRHEYAHYMDYMLNGSSSHGSSWKQCCRIVGAFPTRCFSKERSDSFLAKHEKERMQNEKYDHYSVGVKVLHPVFGEGLITAILGDGLNRIACVSFADVGEKKIAISWIDCNCKKK